MKKPPKLISFGCIVLDADNQVVYTNPGAADIFGFDNTKNVHNPFTQAPEYQPCGGLSADLAKRYLGEARRNGASRFKWHSPNLEGRMLALDISCEYDASSGEIYVYMSVTSKLRPRLKLPETIVPEDVPKIAEEMPATALKSKEEIKSASESLKALNPKFASKEGHTFVKSYEKMLASSDEGTEQLNHAINAVERFSLALDTVERLSLALDAMPLVCNTFDKDFHIVDCNQRAVEMFGMHSKQEFIERFHEIIPPFQPDGRPSGEKAVEFISRAFEGEKIVYDWMDIHPVTGESMPSQVTLHKCKMKGEDYVLAFIQDERKHVRLTTELQSALGDAQLASHAKAQFLFRMSHEIRTPLNAILGMAELALREEMNDAAFEHLSIIKQAGTNLLSIVNDILDFSKIESGTLEIIPEEYTLSSLLNDVVNIVKVHMIDSYVRFNVDVDCTIPSVLYGDAARIRQIMLNLLINSIKYTDNGFINLSIQSEPAGDDVKLTIIVEDSGRGIAAENMPHLFEEFAQFDTLTNKDIEGTGLGLPIVRSLLTLMGGEIFVESVYGKGSTFTVVLTQGVRGDNAHMVTNFSENISVLVFERRTENIEQLSKAFNDIGVKYTTAPTSAVFLNKLLNDKFDFIFIASALYTELKSNYDKLMSDSKIVLIAKFGDSVSEENHSVLTSPIYSIPVAAILSGQDTGSSEEASPDAKSDTSDSFCAPDAKVLVVDDISLNLKVVEGLMAPYCIQVDFCDSGRAAIEAVKHNTYDLILMDHMMPVMDGIEATLHIRRLESPWYSTVPIIALTANAMSGAKEMFFRNGFDDFLSKPIDTAKFHAIIKKWIPKEKKKIAAEDVPAEDSGGANDIADTGTVIEIEGVDTAKGIKLTGGTANNYIQILKIYCENVSEKIGPIKDSLENEDIPLYTTYVHALKSASASIGADTASRLAGELENAGHSNNTDFITAHTDKFLADLDVLLENIGAFIKSKEQIDLRQLPLDKNPLKGLMAAFKEAMLDYDIGAINEHSDNLQKYASLPEIGEAIEKILRSTVLGEYDEAVALIDNILEMKEF